MVGSIKMSRNRLSTPLFLTERRCSANLGGGYLFSGYRFCYTCLFLNFATSISRPKSNFVIRHNFTCTSSNIIYCISCSKCCKLYIGETGRRLSDRIAEHLRSVRNNDVDKPVAWHFNAANHSISDIKVCAISPISGGNYSRKRQVKRLIFKIGTILPHGLNERFSFIEGILRSGLCSSIVYWSTLK